MIIEPLQIADVKRVSPPRHIDARGFFSETYNQVALARHGITAAFVQDNHSFSMAKGVLRGLHFQRPPFAQGKLVRVSRGAVFDVAVDIRAGSPTYGQYVTAILSAENWDQLWIPPGFAHGFCTLEPETEFLYKVTQPYSAEHDAGFAWDDPEIGIPWPVNGEEATISGKDRALPPLAELPVWFHYDGVNTTTA